jgi:hypothetical protein
MTDDLLKYVFPPAAMVPHEEHHPMKQQITGVIFMIGVIGVAIAVHIYFAAPVP